MYSRYLYRFAIPVLLVLVILGCDHKPESVPAGIPFTLAQDRQATLSDIDYQLFFDIPDNRTDSIKATVTISFTWKGAPVDLAIDYLPPASTLKSLKVNGESSKLYYDKEHILVPADELSKETNEVTIEFIAGNGPLNRSDDFLYT